jgi:hypothetical protein
MSNGVNHLAFDGGSTRIRVSRSALGGITKLSIPEEKKKVEKIPTIGEAYATIRTPGVVEVGDGEMEMTSVGWRAWLAVLPDQFGDIEFPITTNQRHTQIRGPGYSVILDRCMILGTKQEIEASEKGNRVTIPLSVIMLIQRGADGTWKTLARRPGTDVSASPAAQQLMF